MKIFFLNDCFFFAIKLKSEVIQTATMKCIKILQVQMYERFFFKYSFIKCILEIPECNFRGFVKEYSLH